MLTNSEYKNTIDKLWDSFWASGISNPINVIEQITYLIFVKLLDDREAANIKKADATGKEYKLFFKDKPSHRWRNFKELPPEEMLPFVRDTVFEELKNVNGFFKNATWHITKPSLLDEAVQTIDDLINKISKKEDNTHDTKGDLYEYMLSKLGTAKHAGQFRTPRHIIDMMVKLVDPQPEDKICDPACGSSGFLVSALHHILENNTSDVIKEFDSVAGDNIPDHIKKKLFKEGIYGFDFDSTMLRIGSMNLILHEIEKPNVKYADTLSKGFDKENEFDVILANPPFTGSIDKSDINAKLKASVNTTKTELLFLALFLRLLNMGGRAAVIVPSGVLSTDHNAYKTIRQKIIENNQLEAVITMSSGVFKPYAGVSTAVLVFTKGGQTDKVWFYQMENDGYSLDDKRTPIEKNDIPDILKKWENREESEKSFNVSFEELKNEEWNLLPSRYKKIEYQPIEFEYTAQEYIQKLIDMEESITSNLYKLKEKVGR